MTVKYIATISSFDIETSSSRIHSHAGADIPFASMYVWMYGESKLNEVKFGRTWEEFVEHCQSLKVKNSLGLDSETGIETRQIIWVHNLAYEFQFIRKLFKWTDVRTLSNRNPHIAVCDLGIEFRCSYALSGSSLDMVARNLTTPVQAQSLTKLTMDYSLIRHKDTPLTQDEIDYCEADIHIVNAYIKEQVDYYGSLDKLPYTNTGRVRNYLKEQIKKNGGSMSRFKKQMKNTLMTPAIYQMMADGFRGGFTHANLHYIDKSLGGVGRVTSMDLTSAYPSVMLNQKFPMGKFQTFKPKCIRSLHERIVNNPDQAIIFTVGFKNLKSIFPYDNYISLDKTYSENPVLNNGRVVSADYLEITITEVDWEIICATYDWEDTVIGDCYYTHKEYLPKVYGDSILEFYKGKEELKGVDGKEQEYQLAKGMLNSIYGMMVTKIDRPDIEYSNEDGAWIETPSDLTDVISQSNQGLQRLTRITYYPWGVWITAYTRKILWEAILHLGEDYVYADTDSVKFLNYEKHKHFFEEYNEYVSELNRHVSKNVWNREVPNDIGFWDYEDTYSKFKTLGAKRYMANDDITVAGLGKKAGKDFINGDIDKFNLDLTVPSEATGKNSRIYVDEEITCLLTDYLGNTIEVTSPSGIHLEAASFTINAETFKEQILFNLANGMRIGHVLQH